MQRIDVNERITSLERLNPSPRPTTYVFTTFELLSSYTNLASVLGKWLFFFSRSPCFEGRWNFEWFGSGSPGLLAARVIFEFSTYLPKAHHSPCSFKLFFESVCVVFRRFPSTLANLSRMEIVIKDANAKATANIKLLNSVTILKCF